MVEVTLEGGAGCILTTNKETIRRGKPTRIRTRTRIRAIPLTSTISKDKIFKK